MSAYLVLNHHSLPFALPAQAKTAMSAFLKICETAMRLGKDTILIDHSQDRHWFQIELAPGYTWRDWHDQELGNSALRDQIRAFRSIATRQPFFSEADILAGAHDFEVWQPDQTPAPLALFAACWHSAPILSFPSRSEWQVSPLELIIRKLDANGHLYDHAASVVNVYSPAVLAAVSADWQAARDAALQNGRHLWQNRTERYPHLTFCGKTETQLCAWRQSEAVFEQVKQTLNILEEFSRQWQARTISDYSHDALRQLGLPHRVSGESESCAQDGKRRRERTFYLPNGMAAYFENHVKLANGQRIHFFPDNATRRIHIAYIGAHLS